MGVQVTLTYSQWLARFPEFTTTVSSDQFTNQLLPAAQVLHRNDGGGPVSNATSQTELLECVVAHLAFLWFGTPGNAPSQVVGRVASAGEGSVNVSLDYGQVSRDQAFWIQTKYGALYWQESAPYRTFRYMPPPRRAFPPFLVGSNWWRN